jgi:hypothetical protein
MMTDTQLKSLTLALEVIKQLLRETPLVYSDMEFTALRYVFAAAMSKGLSTAEVAQLLGCSEQEIIDKMVAVKMRMSYEQ